jgi:hypothetical protein
MHFSTEKNREVQAKKKRSECNFSGGSRQLAKRPFGYTKRGETQQAYSTSLPPLGRATDRRIAQA